MPERKGKAKGKMRSLPGEAARSIMGRLARLRHSSWTYEGAAIQAQGILSEDDLQFLWLPMAHSFGKVLLSAQMACGFAAAVDATAWYWHTLGVAWALLLAVLARGRRGLRRGRRRGRLDPAAGTQPDHVGVQVPCRRLESPHRSTGLSTRFRGA